jgi:hypothetical protein
MEVKKRLLPLPLAALLVALPASADAATQNSYGGQKAGRTVPTPKVDQTVSHGPSAGRGGGRRVH